MPYYEIIVQNSQGTTLGNKKVSLGSGGSFSDDEWTDNNGKAVIEHSARSVTVYVGGRNCGDAYPGRTVVTL